MREHLLSAVLLCALAGAPSAAPAPQPVPMSADGVQRVEVLAGDYFFRPDRIVVRAGIPVELVVRRQTRVVPHDFTLKDAEAGLDLSVPLSRKPTAIRFTVSRPGTYEFYCSKKPPFGRSHRDKGMTGTLEVLP